MPVTTSSSALAAKRADNSAASRSTQPGIGHLHRAGRFARGTGLESGQTEGDRQNDQNGNTPAQSGEMAGIVWLGFRRAEGTRILDAV